MSAAAANGIVNSETWTDANPMGSALLALGVIIFGVAVGVPVVARQPALHDMPEHFEFPLANRVEADSCRVTQRAGDVVRGGVKEVSELTVRHEQETRR